MDIIVKQGHLDDAPLDQHILKDLRRKNFADRPIEDQLRDTQDLLAKLVNVLAAKNLLDDDDVQYVTGNYLLEVVRREA